MIDKQTNTRLKRFAQEARRYLIDQVSTKLCEVLAPDSDASTYEKMKPLYNALLQEVTGNRFQVSGELSPATCNLKPLAERVAYTWFNRFTALRYMDCKHFSPVKIISPQGTDSLPQILTDAKMGIIDATLISSDDSQRVLGLLSGTIESTYHKGDAQSEAYRILLLSACNHFGRHLPFLFKQIKDWMELLLPDDLLGEHGILAMIREVMTEDACQDVEVIGWLYQYYISEKKDEVFAKVKKGKKVQSHEIPAVTQLFTPHWIVKYMVQNSLGRLWLDSHPNSSLKDKMEYYVAQDADPAEEKVSQHNEQAENRVSQDRHPTLQGNVSRDLSCVSLQDRHPALQIKSPEEIKFCDPCCGSGHVLTYAFDLLYDIYSEEGYDPIEIPRLIISKNLFGIEIDERASELAAFALTMKARDKDRAWFSRGLDPNICLLENISFDGDEIDPYMDKCGRDVFTLNFERMLSQFEHADTFGSLIVPSEQDIEAISETLNTKDFRSDVFLAPTHKKVLNLLKQTDYLSTKYHVVVTNPPYLGKGMSDQLSKYLQDFYTDVKSDLFSAFIIRCSCLGIDAAFIGIMSPNVWMYISSYEKLRKWMTTEQTLTNLVELPLSGFTGATVQICAYNFVNLIKPMYRGAFVRLIGYKGADEEMSTLTAKAIAKPDCGWFYRCTTSDFAKIPGSPIAYWITKAVIKTFETCSVFESYATPRQGLGTTDNELFVRSWFEVNYPSIGFGVCNQQEALASSSKWFPYSKGGGFKKWYGNETDIVNWENDGEAIRKALIGKNPNIPRSVTHYFKEGISWGLITSASFSARHSPKGGIFDVGGSRAFPDHNSKDYFLGFLNSKLTKLFLCILNPTLNYQVGDIKRLPILSDNRYIQSVSNIVKSLLALAITDWDSYETSWDFEQLPLLGVRSEVLGVSECYVILREQWIVATLKMQELEEENNLIFIEAYGLQEDLSPEVPLKDITLTCNPFYRYGLEVDQVTGSREFPIHKDLEDRLQSDTMKELISYAVGCMFGRYSLDKPGLVLANQGESIEDYLNLIPNPSFLPDKDNVIPILDGEWFVDDIVSRFSEFLRVAFGTDKYSENINFIEEALGKDLRTYFMKDFYTDHVKRYKKRPIYWLFSSPKGSFNALIYMHRYTPDTVSIMLNGYLREYIHKIRAKSQQLEHQLGSGALGEREKMLTRKEIDRLADVIYELEAWEAKVILPLAEKRIEIDLDDGVKENYAKFGEALRMIK